MISGVVIAVFAIGFPLALVFILLRASREYEWETAGKSQQVAKSIADELDTDEDQAKWVVRELIIGRDYSFLMDAFRPKYLYCKYCSCVGVLVQMCGAHLLTPSWVRCGLLI